MSDLESAAPAGVASVPAPGLQRLRELAAAHRIDPDCDSFFFLRHGQTGRNQKRIFQGPEEPLSARGIGQAQVAAALLARQRLASIVCSDLPRAQMTARIALQAQSGARPPALHEQPGLRERDFGALIGTSTLALDWACVPENGETLERFVDRTRRALLTALDDPAPVLIVAHGGTLHALAALLHVPLGQSLLMNALPLRFERKAAGWIAAALEDGPG